jgi:hypothetical protein
MASPVLRARAAWERLCLTNAIRSWASSRSIAALASSARGGRDPRGRSLGTWSADDDLARGRSLLAWSTDLARAVSPPAGRELRARLSRSPGSLLAFSGPPSGGVLVVASDACSSVRSLMTTLHPHRTRAEGGVPVRTRLPRACRDAASRPGWQPRRSVRLTPRLARGPEPDRGPGAGSALRFQPEVPVPESPGSGLHGGRDTDVPVRRPLPVRRRGLGGAEISAARSPPPLDRTGP